MKLRFLTVFLIMFVACSGLHFVEPTSAANTNKEYLIDHGTTYYTSDGTKMSWKTYWINKNTRKTIETFYYKDSNGKWVIGGKGSIILKKVSKSKIKITDATGHSLYLKTKLNVRNYYWKVFRPLWLKSTD